MVYLQSPQRVLYILREIHVWIVCWSLDSRARTRIHQHWSCCHDLVWFYFTIEEQSLLLFFLSYLLHKLSTTAKDDISVGFAVYSLDDEKIGELLEGLCEPIEITPTGNTGVDFVSPILALFSPKILKFIWLLVGKENLPFIICGNNGS